MIAVWNVAFEQTRWFGHVSAFGCDGGVWVHVNPTLSDIEVRVMSPRDFDAWIADFAARAEVWRIAAAGRTSLVCPGFWCVGVVKRLVGLRSGALSPAGLRRDIVRAGASRVFAQ